MMWIFKEHLNRLGSDNHERMVREGKLCLVIMLYVMIACIP